MHLGTRVVHCYEHTDPYGAVAPLIYLSTPFRFTEPGAGAVSDRGFDVKYSREENPTVRLLERCIALLKGTEDALAFTSGMAAISTALIASLEPGSKVVVPMRMYSQHHAAAPKRARLTHRC